MEEDTKMLLLISRHMTKPVMFSCFSRAQTDQRLEVCVFTAPVAYYSAQTLKILQK